VGFIDVESGARRTDILSVAVSSLYATPGVDRDACLSNGGFSTRRQRSEHESIQDIFLNRRRSEDKVVEFRIFDHRRSRHWLHLNEFSDRRRSDHVLLSDYSLDHRKN
jgi:hypothetical protein